MKKPNQSKRFFYILPDNYTLNNQGSIDAKVDEPLQDLRRLSREVRQAEQEHKNHPYFEKIQNHLQSCCTESDRPLPSNLVTGYAKVVLGHLLGHVMVQDGSKLTSERLSVEMFLKREIAKKKLRPIKTVDPSPDLFPKVVFKGARKRKIVDFQFAKEVFEFTQETQIRKTVETMGDVPLNQLIQEVYK